MTGYIAVPKPIIFIRDNTKDFNFPVGFTNPGSGDTGFGTNSIGRAWIPDRTSRNIYGFSVNSDGLSRDTSSDIATLANSSSLALIGDYMFSLEDRRVNVYFVRTHTEGRPYRDNPSSGGAVGLLASGPVYHALARQGNTVWIIPNLGGTVIAYTASGNALTRNSARDFTIPSGNYTGSMYINNNIWIAEWSQSRGVTSLHGYNASQAVPVLDDALSFDFGRGEVVLYLLTARIPNANGQGTTDGVYSLGVGEATVGENTLRVSWFYRFDRLNVQNVRTPIDTIFYTDKDRHKIYPKKCWISRPASGGGLELAEWYTKDTSIPVISAFQSAPSEIDEDSSPPTNITLTWQTTGTVTRERITDLHRNANVPLSGNKRAVVARPLANTVYSLVATNGSFGSSTAKITVPVFKDCVINSFTVQYITNPLSPHGATVYFNINVTGKPRPTVSIDNGVGGANTHLTYDEDTGVLSGRIVHTFAGPRTFTATLTANNTQANGVAGPAATRTVQVIIP